MAHIRQKNSRKEDGFAYTVVIPEGYEDNLREHPSVVEHPDVFEVTEEALPEEYQKLIYQSY